MKKQIVLIAMATGILSMGTACEGDLPGGIGSGGGSDFDPIEYALGGNNDDNDTDDTNAGNGENHSSEDESSNENYGYWPVEPSLPMEQVEIGYINDGDTVTLTESSAFNEDGRVRFTGIDTPEMNYDKDEGPDPFAQEATDYVEEMTDGRNVYIEYDPEYPEDMYGRTLGYVWIDIEEDGVLVMLNALLVEEGLATVMTIEPNTTHHRTFERLEVEAKRNEVGMWLQ